MIYSQKMFQKMRLIKDLFVRTKALPGQEKKERKREIGGGKERGGERKWKGERERGGRRVRHTQRGRIE